MEYSKSNMMLKLPNSHILINISAVLFDVILFFYPMCIDQQCIRPEAHVYSYKNLCDPTPSVLADDIVIPWPEYKVWCQTKDGKLAAVSVWCMQFCLCYVCNFNHMRINLFMPILVNCLHFHCRHNTRYLDQWLCITYNAAYNYLLSYRKQPWTSLASSTNFILEIIP